MNKRQLRAVLPQIEIKISSLCFIFIFLILVFRIGSGVLSGILISLQNHLETESLLITNVTAWISQNSQWTGEGSQWLWVWLVMFGIAEAERTQSNLAVDLLRSRMPLTVQKMMAVVFDLIYVSAIGFIVFKSFQELERSRNSLPSTLPFTNLWLYISLTLGFTFLALRIILRVVENFLPEENKKTISKGHRK
jgi:TRAP-type C4-dicarboxylate transport system permease small subunit